MLTESTEETHPVTLDAPIIEYLDGPGDVSLVETYSRRDSGCVFPLPSFNVKPENATVVTRLLAGQGRCHILLHGRSDTGKTEFARAAVRAAGRRTFFLQYGGKGTPADRQLALIVAINTVAHQPDGVLVVDEADTFLGRHAGGLTDPTIDKGWLNDFLDRSSVRVIWIA
ncbi:MAG: AAA family ATPase [Planctomycetota bacterium]